MLAPAVVRANESPKAKQWYGETLTIEGIALGGGALAAAVAAPPVALRFGALGLYAFGAPIAHLVHGKSRSWRSELRAAHGAPDRGLGLYAVCPKSEAPVDSGCGTTIATLGMVLGATIASAIDAGALAYEEAKPEPRYNPGAVPLFAGDATFWSAASCTRWSGGSRCSRRPSS